MLRSLALSAVLVVSAHAAVDSDRFVDALRERETGAGPVRDGARGERGPWQITRAVWTLQMPGTPFAQARQEIPARACALKHVRWLAAQLEARGVEASAFNLALAWNAGLEGATRGRAPIRAYEYARAVEAIYNGAIGQNTLKSPAAMVSRRRFSMRFIPMVRELTKLGETAVSPVGDPVDARCILQVSEVTVFRARPSVRRQTSAASATGGVGGVMVIHEQSLRDLRVLTVGAAEAAGLEQRFAITPHYHARRHHFFAPPEFPRPPNSHAETRQN